MDGTPETASDPAAHKRRVNDLIAATLADNGSEQVAFYCECPSPRCFAPVLLRADEYGARRLDASWSPRAASH